MWKGNLNTTGLCTGVLAGEIRKECISVFFICQALAHVDSRQHRIGKRAWALEYVRCSFKHIIECLTLGKVSAFSFPQIKMA